MQDHPARLLARLPSLRGLLVFNAAAQHLNLVRAAQELSVSQGALSRQLKSLEEHLGISLFERGPRGLKFTPEGELLYDYTSRAFSLVGEGIHRLGLQSERNSLVVSVARSFAQRVLAPRLAGFTKAHPHIDLHLDVHRYYADLETSGADISIRLGRGDWENYESQPILADGLVAVCAETIYAQIKNEKNLPDSVPLLTYQERDYIGAWNSGVLAYPLMEAGRHCIRFNDSSTMLSALESGLGVTVTRRSLVEDALSSGVLMRVFEAEHSDGLAYHAVCSQRASHKTSVKSFIGWLCATFDSPAGSSRT